MGQPWKRWQRGKEILRTFSRHGFGWLLSLNLDGKAAAEKFQTAGDSFPRMLESLGPVFVKLGQNLAARPGLFEGPIMDALARIEDRGDPLPFSALQPFLRKQMGSDPSIIFSTFREEPVASSSTGWVYRATLKRGREVVLKVRRPGVERLIEVDLDLLFRTARFIEKHTGWLAGPDARQVLEEVQQGLKQDLYLLEEGRNCERLQKNLASFAQIHIPAVFWEFSSPDVLTLEALDGVKLSHPEALIKASLSPASLGETLASLYLKQILADGFFHTCPTPKKIALNKQGRFLWYDYKPFGSISPAGIGRLKGILAACQRLEIEKMGEFVVDSQGKAAEDGRAFSRELRSILDRKGTFVDELPLWQEFFASILQLAREMRHSIPREILLAGQTLALLETTLRWLSPEMRLLDMAVSADE